MGSKANRQFNWRAFVSVLTAISFVGMTFSGVILFVVPPGRIANWSGWTLIGLTKHQWIALHLWFSLIFVAASVWHLWLNWRPFVGYFKNKVSKAFALRGEWTVALILCVVVLLATLAGVRPFSSLSEWNESIKHSWDDPGRRGPIPHAELMTLTELAKYVEDVDVDTMLGNLKAQGIEVASGAAVVGELAEEHGTTPQQLYDIAVGRTGPGRGRGGGARGGFGGGGRREETSAGQSEHLGSPAGRGFGRMTVSQYCDEIGLDEATALQSLRAAGFKASADTTMREIADAAGVHPSEVRRILTDTGTGELQQGSGRGKATYAPLSER